MSLNIAPKQLAEDESRFVSKVGTTVFHDALVEFSKDPAEEMSSEEDEVGENQPMKPMSDSEDEAREKQPMKPMSDSEDEAREKQPMKPMSDSEDEAGEKQPVKPMPDSEDEVQSSAKDPVPRAHLMYA
ncbi:unnamed protein product [Symbiodinium natans]|uniref:Uncharacterized protein n=1 Tax=Symbiodinium natans TaxID=878477 RepID=A0A812KZC5_9DINO|nr:unnamed protein product [Symbiodinium natans]